MENIFLEKEDFLEIFKFHLKTESYSMSIETLFGQRKLTQINYKPYYQRNYVWDKHKASYFIESILLGTDIPPLIFYKKDSAIEVIDGRQRFETIRRFIFNQLILTKKGLFSLKKLSRCSYDGLLNDPEGKEIISRMENEELYTSLVYLEYKQALSNDIWKHLYICQQQDRINVRIRTFREITQLLKLASQEVDGKAKFSQSIKSVESFIRKLELVLLDKNIEYEGEKRQYFRSELIGIFKAQRDLKMYKRTKQDFYVLWCALAPINEKMVARYRIEIKQEIKSIFNAFKQSNLNNSLDTTSSEVIDNFKQLVCDFHGKYQQQERRLKLTQKQKNEAIALQQNLDPISGAPLFIGDRAHADHIVPIAVGGSDSIANIQIAHPCSNLTKGAKYS